MIVRTCSGVMSRVTFAILVPLGGAAPLGGAFLAGAAGADAALVSPPPDPPPPAQPAIASANATIPTHAHRLTAILLWMNIKDPAPRRARDRARCGPSGAPSAPRRPRRRPGASSARRGAGPAAASRCPGGPGRA